MAELRGKKALWGSAVNENSWLQEGTQSQSLELPQLENTWSLGELQHRSPRAPLSSTGTWAHPTSLAGVGCSRGNHGGPHTGAGASAVPVPWYTEAWWGTLSLHLLAIHIQALFPAARPTNTILLRSKFTDLFWTPETTMPLVMSVLN